MREATQSAGYSIRDNSLAGAERRNRYAGIGVLLSLILYAFLVDPHKVTLFRCFFREFTGWNCFACGLSHSLHASACLEWTAAVKYHLFGPVLFLSAWALSVYWILELIIGRKWAVRISPAGIRAWIAVIALIWLGYWSLYLIPSSPGTGVLTG